MNLYATLILLIAVAIVQTALAPVFSFFGARPDLMLVVVACWGMFRGAEAGLIWGATAGLILDLLSGAPFGLFTFSLAAVGFLTGLGEANVFRANILLPGATIIATTILQSLLVLAMLQFSGRPVTWDLSLSRMLVPAAVFNLICLTVLYGPLRWLHRRTGRQEIPIG